MSSLDEQKGQVREIGLYPGCVGRPAPWWNAGQNLKQNARQNPVEVTTSPTTEELPLEDAKPFQHREEVHLAHDYQPTLWTPKHAHRKGGGFTPADTVVEGRTKMIGRANKKGWRHTEETHKVRRKRNRAMRWAEKNL